MNFKKRGGQIGQGDILRVLKNKDWLSTVEISKLTFSGRQSVCDNIRRLKRQAEIKVKYFTVGKYTIPKYKLNL